MGVDGIAPHEGRVWHEWVQDPSEHRTLGTEEVEVSESQGICVNTQEKTLFPQRACSGGQFPYNVKKEFIGPGLS